MSITIARPNENLTALARHGLRPSGATQNHHVGKFILDGPHSPMGRARSIMGQSAKREDRMNNRFAFCLAAAFCTALTVPAFSQGGYHILNSFTLGGEGGWDYLNLDPDSGRLFITRGSHVMVDFDPATGKLLGDIDRVFRAFTARPSLAIAPMSAKAAPTGSPSLTPKAWPNFPISPSARGRTVMQFDPVSKRLFTFNAGSKDATARGPGERPGGGHSRTGRQSRKRPSAMARARFSSISKTRANWSPSTPKPWR